MVRSLVASVATGRLEHLLPLGGCEHVRSLDHEVDAVGAGLVEEGDGVDPNGLHFNAGDGGRGPGVLGIPEHVGELVDVGSQLGLGTAANGQDGLALGRRGVHGVEGRDAQAIHLALESVGGGGLGGGDGRREADAGEEDEGLQSAGHGLSLVRSTGAEPG